MKPHTYSKYSQTESNSNAKMTVPYTRIKRVCLQNIKIMKHNRGLVYRYLRHVTHTNIDISMG